jgi:phosphoribosylaminoimidazole carboxylase PurK protein
MLAEAAKKLGFSTVVLDPTPESPAGQVADLQIVGNFKDADKIYELAEMVDVMTFEIESANAEALEELLALGHDINPSPFALSIIKDKYAQKKFLEERGIPVAASLEVTTREDIVEAGKKFGYPILLKARRDAYDGRGNALVENQSEIEKAMEKLSGRSLYVEQFVPFTKELAVVVARGKGAETLAYPAVETIHKNNICHVVLSPAPVDSTVALRAEELGTSIINLLGGVGVFAVEMFLTKENNILVNEIAPRVHNSGHHSIEAHQTSQFEQHIRAITGMPLGSIERITPASVMINILGERKGSADLQGVEEIAKIPGAFLHIYNKKETLPERKMGHITILDVELQSALEKAQRARSSISI